MEISSSNLEHIFSVLCTNKEFLSWLIGSTKQSCISMTIKRLLLTVS